MKKQLIIMISAVVLSACLSGSYFYQKGKAASVQHLLSFTSADYGRLNHVKTTVEEILTSDAKGDRIKNSLYLLRSIENANSALYNTSFLFGHDDIDLSNITHEFSLTAADLSNYIYRDSLGFDTKKTEEKLRKHAEVIQLITESLTRDDLRRMDQERINHILSRLQNSLPQ
ncbi:hypothetical protein [Brevibacillus sp. NRS-1366]|uniref:hypothetical protein n=1 Tax=Brevibacillus sp. NRS-1366 TaxID=3233899 RepID=UPI003D1D2A6A